LLSNANNIPDGLLVFIYPIGNAFKEELMSATVKGPDVIHFEKLLLKILFST
jgi:hypothetical protein